MMLFVYLTVFWHPKCYVLMILDIIVFNVLHWTRIGKLIYYRFNTPNDCVIRTKGYWTYRVCYGGSVIQFHEAMPSKRRLVPKEFITIGGYDKDLDWEEKLTKNVSKLVRFFGTFLQKV